MEMELSERNSRKIYTLKSLLADNETVGGFRGPWSLMVKGIDPSRAKGGGHHGWMDG